MDNKNIMGKSKRKKQNKSLLAIQRYEQEQKDRLRNYKYTNNNYTSQYRMLLHNSNLQKDDDYEYGLSDTN